MGVVRTASPSVGRELMLCVWYGALQVSAGMHAYVWCITRSSRATSASDNSGGTHLQAHDGLLGKRPPSLWHRYLNVFF